MYTEQDLINILAIYQSCCHGDREQTKKVYAALYGTKPSDRIITKAINSAIKSGKQLENKPAAAKRNKLIDCKFSEDSVEVKEEIIIDCDEVDSSVKTEQSMLYTNTGSDVNKELISGTPNGLETKLQLVPVVYTTRLNDMNIFKQDLHSLTVNGIVQAVNAESKPQLKNEAVVQSEILTSNSLSFDELVAKVDQYNIFATSVDFGDYQIATNSRSYEPLDHESCVDDDTPEKDLLGLCRPLSVVLTKCNIKCERCYVKANKKTPTVFDIKKCPICITDTYRRNKEIKNNSVPSSDNFFLVRQTVIRQFHAFFHDFKANIVMKNYYSNTTDIYCIYSTALLKFYFHISHVIHSDKELSKYVIGTTIIEYINCCWHSRFTNLKKLWNFIDINTLPLILLLPHPCSHNNCKCCCNPIKSKNNNLENIVIENIDISIDSELDLSKTGIEISKEESQKYQSAYNHLLSITNGVETNSWIDKALQYSKKLNPKIKAAVESVSFQDVFAIQIVSSKYLEHYTVRNGKIHSYFDINHQPSEPYLSQINSHEKVIKGSGCCWLSRENFLSSDLPIFLKSPDHFVHDTYDIVCFLKRPHLCPVGDCNCCCKIKNENSKSTKIEPIELSTVIKESSNYKSKHVKTLKFYKILNSSSPLHSDNQAKSKTDDSCKQFINQKVKPVILNKRTKTSECKEKTVKTTSNRKFVPRILAKRVISVPVLTKQVDDNIVTINQPDNVTDSFNSVQNPVNVDPVTQPPVTHDPAIQDPMVKTLIANVLERFKNIRLTLNSEGKVVAELDTPATNLSKAELEILSNILTHAQEQVKLLGIANHVTENVHIGMINPSMPNFQPVLENTNTTATNSLFSSESACANQNLHYNNNLTTKNISAHKDSTFVEKLIPISTANEENTNNQQNVASYTKQQERTQDRTKMDFTVDSSTDLYQAFTNITFLKREQYRQSFSKLSYMKTIQYNSKNVLLKLRSFQMQKPQITQKETSPFGLKIKNVYCLSNNDEVAATVKSTSTGRASQSHSVRGKRRAQNKLDSNNTNNSTAKRIRVTSPSRLTGDSNNPQTLPLLRNVRNKYHSSNQSNFLQPISVPAESMCTLPTLVEPPFQENKMLMVMLSSSERMNFNGFQGASSSDVIEIDNDDDDCILGV